MRRGLQVAVALAAVVLVAAAPAASAPGAVAVRAVDDESYPTLGLTVVTPERTRQPPKVAENGLAVPVLSAKNLGRAKSVVLAVDRSRSMKGRPLEDAVAAARAFVAAKPPGDRIAVSTFARRPVLLAGFSTATIDADTALRTVGVDSVQGTTLYDGLVLAASALEAEPLAARVIIIVTDGNETRSTATLDDVVVAAGRAGAAVYPIAIESSRFNPAPLRELARRTGGVYHGAKSTGALHRIYAAIAGELARTWRLEYVTAARPGDQIRLTALSVGRRSEPVSVSIPGAPSRSPSKPFLPEGLLRSSAGMLALGAAVALLVFFCLVLLSRRPREEILKARLAPHVVGERRYSRRRSARDRLEALSALFRATERAFGHLRPWRHLERLLERADMPLRAVEFVYLALGCGFGLGLLAAVAALPALVVLLALAGGGTAPYVVVLFKSRRRLRAFEDQLPDLLVTLAAALKAGHSFRHGIQTVVDEGRPPASKEFQRVLTETSLGRPMDAALNEMTERIGSKNFEFVITAVTIQRQVGGSLAGLFDMIAETVRQRQQFARKLRSLTAMGRMSAYVLAGLPFFLAVAVTLLNPTYMDPLYHSSAGHKLIVSGLVMMALGSLMLKKIVSFKG